MGLNLGNAAGAGAMGLPLPGGTPAAGAGQPQLQNVLAQMLAGQGPAYQPGDTRWGMAGDRLLRFTPQQGNAGMAGGTFGKGGTPPPAGGGAGGITSPLPNVPGDVHINWDNLISATNPPPPDPAGAPAINAAMEKLKQGPTGPAPSTDALGQLRATWKALAANPPERSATRAEKDAWFAQKTAAEQAYIQAQKNSGLGPGNTTG